METLSAAAVIPLTGGGGGGEPDSYIKSAELNTARTILTLTMKDDTTVEVPVIADGSTLPSGTEAGELALLLQDVEQASGTITSGFYRYNGSSWDKIRDVLFIDSAESITIQGYEVPELTNKQVIDAYNSIVDGRPVIIRDKDETLSMYAGNASSLDDLQVAVYASFIGKLYLEYKTNDDGDDDDADISGTPVGGIVVDIGSSQYVWDTYSLPAIAKAKLDELYANHKKGISQVAKWTLLGSESYYGIVSADYIAGSYSVDLLVHNKYHCSYTWADATTGNVNPEVISGDLETFVFKGYVSTAQPANANINELWYSSSTMPATFPVNVKRYDGTSWSTTTEQYTPKALEMWANVNDSHGYYWFNGWNEIDVTADPDDATIGRNALGQLELKDKGHDFAKLTDASIGSGLEKSSSGTQIKHKNSIAAGDDDATLAPNTITLKKMHYDTEGHIDTASAGKTITFRNGIQSDASGNVEHTNAVTAGTHQAVVQTQSGATGTEGGSLAFKKHNYDAQGHSTQADQADSTVTMEAGLRLYGNKLGHTNAITAQTTAKVYASELDAQGHHTGTQEGFEVQKKGATLSDDDTHFITSGLAKSSFDSKVGIISNPPITTYSTRQALFEALKNSGELTKHFHGTFSTARENPHGTTSITTDRFIYIIDAVNIDASSATTGYCRMLGLNRNNNEVYVCYKDENASTWSSWVEMATIEEFEPSVALADGTALKISSLETNAKVIVHGGKWLEFNSYFSISVSQATAGWASAIKINPSFKYTIDGTRQSRTIGSMWAGGAYVNTAFSRLSGGDIGMYYYGALLNQTGGVNVMLKIPVKLK